jgi:predicted negative regulator of RcsB-dependent stress response
VDRITRKGLKTDAFAREVGHTVEYVGAHRRQFTRLSAIVVVVAIVAGGFYYYNKRQQAARERELHEAMRIQDAGVGTFSGRATILTFPTQQEKNEAAIKAFSEIADKHSGTDEGAIARYYLGTIAVDEGRLDDAVKSLRQAADSGKANYDSLAKLALAEAYHLQGKTAESETLLRPLIEKPTLFVSKAQATIALARILANSKPDEARKLLEPLRTEPGAVSQAALNAIGELPEQ